MSRTLCVLVVVAGVIPVGGVAAQDLRSPKPTTYCNPMDLAYAYAPFDWAVDRGKHRATADPAMALYDGAYYLFSTNQKGYWRSDDLLGWRFISRSFLPPSGEGDDLNAPAVWVQDGALHVYGSRYPGDFPIWRSVDPDANEWEVAANELDPGAWDPSFFQDDDGRVYLYHGSSNTKPLFGVEVDDQTFERIGDERVVVALNDELHGWERFGEANDNTGLAPFVEGPWMNKAQGRYYLQYAAPGTEFSGYADGVYVGDSPLGPFEYQRHNPFAYKPGGFARGAGHGATFVDRHGNWWHTGTIAISSKDNFERRLGLWPAGVDDRGVLFCNTAYGDYPHYAPDGRWEDVASGAHSTFTGWMLLSRGKPARASSWVGGHEPNAAVDEDIRTYWSAVSGDAGEWFEVDLGEVVTVRGLQVNHADHDATLMGRVDGVATGYRVLHSADGSAWSIVIDESRSTEDTPHGYFELSEPLRTRYVKIENVEVPSGTFALSGLRVFGLSDGDAPGTVEMLEVRRGASEPRNAWILWKETPGATGYTIYAGPDAETLYNACTVLDGTDVVYRALHAERDHAFAIEAFNEAGVGPRSDVVISIAPRSGSDGGD